MNDSQPRPVVLIVEDKTSLALLLQELLENAGYCVLRAERVPAATALAETVHIDAAILDIDLAGVEVFPAAAALRRRGIPFLFTSGSGRSDLASDYREAIVLQKPYDPTLLERELAMLLSRERPSPPNATFPEA